MTVLQLRTERNRTERFKKVGMAHPQVRGHIGGWVRKLFQIYCPQQSIPFSRHKQKTSIIVHGSKPLRILFSIFLFFLFLARERGRLCAVFPVFYGRVQASMFYFTQSSLAAQSVQLQTILQWGAMHCFNVHCTYMPWATKKV